MKNKINIIYPIILIGFIIVLILVSKNTDNNPPKDEINNLTQAEDKTVDGTEYIGDEESATYSEEEKAMIKEAKKNINQSGQDTLKGTYPDRPHSINVNTENVDNGYTYIDPIRLVKFEFIGYEELDNLSEYNTNLDSDDGMALYRYGFTYDYKCLKQRGIINDDGTINPVENITKVRLLDGVYGDVIRIDEALKVKPLKITVRITNMTEVSLLFPICNNNCVTIHKLITMDDGNLYLFDTMYNESEPFVGEYVYCSANIEPGPDNYTIPNDIYLEGKESIVVDYIFMLNEYHKDKTYITMSIPEERAVSYYANYVRYFPVSNLEKLK